MRDSDVPRSLSVHHLHYPLTTEEAEDSTGASPYAGTYAKAYAITDPQHVYPNRPPHGHNYVD